VIRPTSVTEAMLTYSTSAALIASTKEPVVVPAEFVAETTSSEVPGKSGVPDSRPADENVSPAGTALTITEAMQAMTAGLPWVPGDVELDHELELIAGAMHLLAARATERRTELAGDVAASVGRSAAELAAIRSRFGVNVAVLIAEGNR
jgi:hypothetical protein